MTAAGRQKVQRKSVEYSTVGIEEPYFSETKGERVTRVIRHVVGDGYERVELRGPSRRRMLMGVVSTDSPDSHHVSLNPMGCVLQLPLPLLAGHGLKDKRSDSSLDRERIGEVIWIQKSAREIAIGAVLDNSRAADAAWGQILAGELKALSHELRDVEWRGVVGGVRYVEAWRMIEVSVCQSGSNPDAKFTVVGNHEIDFY